jgi:Ca2+-binding RTX toxin-like protein
MERIEIDNNTISNNPIILDEFAESLEVEGTLNTGEENAVTTENTLNQIEVDRNGTIESENTAIQVDGVATLIENEGTISGDFNGINIANGDIASASIDNRGLITSESRAVNIGGVGGVLFNRGEILTSLSPRNGTVYGDVTGLNIFIENDRRGVIDVGEGNDGDAISLELGANVNGSVVNEGLIQGRGVPIGNNQSAAVRLYWVPAAGAETSIFNGDIINEGTLTAENAATVIIQEQTQLNGTIFNEGTIIGGAIEDGKLAIDVREAVGGVTVINEGEIEGNVELSAEDDSFNGIDGEVIGVVNGNGGNDIVLGGDEEDVISGGSENDFLDGDRENDTLSGDEGNDFIVGAQDDDFLEGGDGNDFFFGIDGDGNDTSYGGLGNDFVRGGNDNDQIFGEQHNDLLIGNNGDDIISGGAGINLVSGGNGSDRFVLEPGGLTTILDFELGEDLLVLGENLTFDQLTLVPDLFGTSTGIQITETGEQIATLTFVPVEQLGEANFVSFEQALEGVSNSNSSSTTDESISTTDTVNGTFEDDLIEGTDEGDFINGGAGNDTLNSGIGEDVTNGGDGDDLITGSNFLNGDAGNDTIEAVDGNNFVNGGEGHDLISVGFGENFVNGDGGNDTIFGGDFIDLISGGDGDDVISAGGGTDIVFGELGNDTLEAGAGTDELDGGEGDDVLIGAFVPELTEGVNIDELTGGVGSDTFILGDENGKFYAAAGDQDFAVIADFDFTQDVIQLNGTASQFTLAPVEQSGVSGLGILAGENQDLVAIIQAPDSGSIDLRAGYFNYV